MKKNQFHKISLCVEKHGMDNCGRGVLYIHYITLNLNFGIFIVFTRNFTLYLSVQKITHRMKFYTFVFLYLRIHKTVGPIYDCTKGHYMKHRADFV